MKVDELLKAKDDLKVRDKRRMLGYIGKEYILNLKRVEAHHTFTQHSTISQKDG